MLPFLCLWLLLINQLGAQWSIYEQYHYGWAVPFLCAYLVYRRCSDKANSSQHLSVSAFQRFRIPSWLIYVLFTICALLYAATRLLHEANPIWRLTSWALALEVIGLTLLWLRMIEVRDPKSPVGDQTSQVRSPSSSLAAQFLFPLCFFLVAVPWPSALEDTVVQSFMRLNTASTVELLGLFGIPALQRGNVIEISTGLVGIDEACSGIRSLQASLMISLFLGEIYRLSVLRRAALCGAGFLMAFVFNVGRTLLLTCVASRDGLATMGRWHDPAGVGVLLACFVGIGMLAIALRRKRPEISGQSAEVTDQKSELRNQTSDVPKFQHFSFSVFQRFGTPSALLLLWLLAVEVGIEIWFRAHEGKGHDALAWSVEWPTNSTGFKRVELSKQVRSQLLYDQAASGSWKDEDGTSWQMFYLRWFPSHSLAERVKVQLTKTHTPDVCLEAAGMKLREEQGVIRLEVNAIPLEFRKYLFEAAGKRLDVFFAVAEDSSTGSMAANLREDTPQRIKAALAVSRNYGQRTLEIAIGGYNNSNDADAALKKQLERIVVREKGKG